MKTKLADLFEAAGLNVRSYVGRGMMGQSCLAVTCDDVGDLLAAIASDGDFGEHVETLRQVRTDSMGKGVIYYWPGVVGPPEHVCDHDDYDDE